LVVAPLGILLVALSVANRAAIPLVLDPFGGKDPKLVIEAPLFLFLLGAFALGLLFGGFATWLGQGKWRKTARARDREVTQ
jgi:hypothetical protein